MSETENLRQAVERLADYFRESATRPGVLARRVLQQVNPGDAELTDSLARQLSGELRADGSLGGGFVPTAWRVIELVDLGEAGAPALEPPIQWLLGRQEQPGAFGIGCTAQRHAERTCEHYVRGFFAAAPPEQRVAPITFPNGKVFRAEGAARFASSCLALRAVISAGCPLTPALVRHLESMAVVRDVPQDQSGPYTTDVIALAASALATAPAPYRDGAAALAVRLLALQAANGTWPGADFFNVVEALLLADSPPARIAMLQAVPALLSRQRSDGSFSGAAQQERAWIGLRVLLAVEQG